MIPERLPNEPPNAYAAFLCWAVAVPDRSLTTLSRLIGRSRASLYRWRKAYDWDGRVVAFDAGLAEETFDAEFVRDLADTLRKVARYALARFLSENTHVDADRLVEILKWIVALLVLIRDDRDEVMAGVEQTAANIVERLVSSNARRWPVGDTSSGRR